MFDNILVVCVGNICRSPALELLLKARFPDKQISSAGLGALVGKPVDPEMKKQLLSDGIDPQAHVARQLNREMLNRADVVLVMEPGHRNAIADILPGAMGKTFLAGKWLGDESVGDPYRKSPEVFAICYAQLVECADSWVSKL